MRSQMALFVMVATVLACAAAPAVGEEPSWWSRLWGRRQAAPAKNEAAVKAEVKAPPVIPSREKEIWLRRTEICQRLREIALTNNDDTLLRKADQLDQRAWETYMQRISTVRSVADGIVLSANEAAANRKSVNRKTTVEDEP